MKSLFFLALISLVNLNSVTFAADNHQHHPAPKDSIQKKNETTAAKFESDAPLRSHMGIIRSELQSTMSKVHNKTFNAKDYQQLAGKIDKSVQSIFKDCKLKPDADAALHNILSEIMSGSASMKNGADPEARPKGFLKVAKALETYSQTFVDPTWKPLTHL